MGWDKYNKDMRRRLRERAIEQGKKTGFKRGILHPSFNKPMNFDTEVAKFLNAGLRSLRLYKQWHSEVKARDKVCCECGSDSDLAIHHIIPVKDIIKEYNLLTIEDILACDILWDINNGQMLCSECHKLQHV